MKLLKSILAWLSGIFSSNKSAVKSDFSLNRESDDLTGNISTIGLYTGLVSNLKVDHEHLLELYTAIIGEAKKQNYSVVREKLKQFKMDFGAHLNTENTKFYGYLEQQLEQNSNESKEMRGFRRDMRNIERSVNKFLDSWIDTGVDQKTLAVFLGESEKVANALVQRIQSEEHKLYPIYEKHVENCMQTAS